jgi:hypothetical protein
MKYLADGRQGRDEFNKQTQGDAELVAARDNGSIQHTGNVGRVRALYGGRIVINGTVEGEASASDDGEVYCHGSPQKVFSSHSGRVIIDGNPGDVSASDDGSVVVFGMPEKVRANYSGSVIIVDYEDSGRLPEISLGDHASVRILSPGNQVASSPTTRYLMYGLDQLFPERQDNPRYTTIAEVLKQNRDRYITQ